MSNEVRKPNPVLAEVERSATVAELRGLTSRLSPLQEYARQAGQSLDQINDLAEGRVMAMCKGGYLLREMDKGKGGRPRENSSQAANSFSPYQEAVAEAGLGKDTAARWQIMSWAYKPENLVKPYCDHQRDIGRTITSEEVYRIGKRAMPRDLEEPEPIEGKYSVLIIDPPWPMERIERDEVRPNQTGFDYPTMSEDEIFRLGTDDDAIVSDMMEDDCHVFLWTTEKFIPMAHRLLERWGLRYVLTMVWHKPGGFQPFNLPQYNCEFVLYGRRGGPDFIETSNFFCCFNAPRREHSRKPDEFYETIRRVTSGRAIEVFQREPRKGFDGWGNQTRKFSTETAAE